MAADWEQGGHRVLRFWTATADWQRPGGPSRIRQALLCWNNREVLGKLRALHERERPDVWIIHNIVPVISLGVYRLARELRVPVVRWLHNCRPVTVSGNLFAGQKPLRPEDPLRAWKEIVAGSWNGPFATAFLALAYGLARARGYFAYVRAAVAVSEATADVFRRAGWFTDRLHTLRHCWNPVPAPTEPKDDGYFLFLGRVVFSKGADFLVELWRRPELAATPLVIAGDGPSAARLREISPPSVRWAGYLEGDEKLPLIRGCRAMVFPNLAHEALTTGIYEAYQYKNPVLASDLGGSREIVVDGQTGFLLPPGDADAWFRAVCTLDPATAHRMGTTARTWLEQNVSVAQWNRQFDAIMAKVLAPGGAAPR